MLGVHLHHIAAQRQLTRAAAVEHVSARILLDLHAALDRPSSASGPTISTDAMNGHDRSLQPCTISTCSFGSTATASRSSWLTRVDAITVLALLLLLAIVPQRVHLVAQRVVAARSYFQPTVRVMKSTIAVVVGAMMLSSIGSLLTLRRCERKRIVARDVGIVAAAELAFGRGRPRAGRPASRGGRRSGAQKSDRARTVRSRA